MDPNEIELKTIDKLFEYEKHSRFIDELSTEELKNFSKLYFKTLNINIIKWKIMLDTQVKFNLRCFYYKVTFV